MPHQPLDPNGQAALAQAGSALRNCGAGQRDQLFAAREALVNLTQHLRGTHEEYIVLTEALQRMLGLLMRKDRLTEMEALQQGQAMMSFLTSVLVVEDEFVAPPGLTGPTLSMGGRPGQASSPLPGFMRSPTPAAPGTQPPAGRPATIPPPPGMGDQAAPVPPVAPVASGPPMDPVAPLAPVAPVAPQAPLASQAPVAPQPPGQPIQPPPVSAASPAAPESYATESRLGDILMGMGWITPEQLDRALVLQKVAKRRLGEVLVVMQAISEEQLHDALQKQRSQAGPLSGPTPPVIPGEGAGTTA